MTTSFSFYEALCAARDLKPCADAIVSEDGSMDFAAFAERVERMMAFVARNGWSPDHVSGVAVHEPIAHLVTTVALLCLGAPQVALPRHETAAANRAVAESLGVTLILCETPEPWMSAARTLAVTADAGASDPGAPPHAGQIKPDNVGFFVKTSGSTSVPKLFGISFRRLAILSEGYGADPNQRRVLRTSGTEFDSSRIYRACALRAGRPAIMPPRDRADIGAFSHRFDVTQIHCGAYFLSSLARESARATRLPTTTSILTGGSRISGVLRRSIAESLTHNLFVSYATSEVGEISIATPDEHERYPEGVGFPVADAEVEIVDANGALMAPGEPGELRVRKRAAPPGYVGRDASSGQFRHGWFYPNDLISQTESGLLIFHGRADDVMLLNGVKILPAAIEDTLSAHPDVAEVVAFAQASRIHGEIPAAAVILRPSAEVTQDQLLDHCRSILGFRAPRRIVLLDEFPRTANGKPLKRALTDL